MNVECSKIQNCEGDTNSHCKLSATGSLNFDSLKVYQGQNHRWAFKHWYSEIPMLPPFLSWDLKTISFASSVIR